MPDISRFEAFFRAEWSLRHRPEDLRDVLEQGRRLHHPSWVGDLASAIVGGRPADILCPRGVIVPLLGPSDDSDCIGVVACDASAANQIEPPLGRDAFGAVAETSVLDAVSRLGSAMVAEPWHTRLRVVSHRDFGGTSHSLAVALAALATHLGATPDAGLAATAEWSVQAEAFVPVLPEALRRKVQIARRWGCTRFAVVEGQVGLDAVSELSLEAIVLPRELDRIAVRVGSFASGAAGERLAAALLHEFMRSPPEPDQWQIRGPHVERMLAGAADDTVRISAMMIGAACAVHCGESAEASRYAEAARELESTVPLPDGPIGDLLRERMTAQRSIIAIDIGQWDGRSAEHRAVDRAILRMQMLDWRRRHESLMFHLLLQTRARRLLYRGRLDGDGRLVRRALADATFDRERWPDLLDGYAHRELGLSDTNSRRAENLVIDCWCDAARLGVAIEPRAAELLKGLWPCGEPEPSNATLRSGYETLAWLRWHAVSGTVTRRGIAAAAAACRSRIRPERPLAYPWTSVAEWILLDAASASGRDSPPVDDAECAKLRDALRNSELFRAGEGSILRVLALRAASVLRQSGGADLPVAGPTEPRLRALFDSIAADLGSAVHRCPY